MSRGDSLTLRIARSDAPLPPPDRPCRVEFGAYRGIGVYIGTMLGLFGGVFAGIAVRWAQGWPSSPRPDLVPVAWLIAGTILGGALGWMRGDFLARGRAILMDAEGLRFERPGREPFQLPWLGLRRREGRIPRLVAEDGREIALDAEGWTRSPDSIYLRELVKSLPEVAPAPLRPIWHYFLVALGCAVALAAAIPLVRYREDAEGVSIVSPVRIVACCVAAPAMIGLTMALAIALGRRSEEKALAPEPGNEIGDLFRTHRYEPPANELREGVLYRPVDEAFLVAFARQARRARIALLIFFPLLFVVALGVTYLPNPKQDPAELPAIRLLFGVVGALPTVLLLIGLLGTVPTTLSARVRAEGDRLHIFHPDGREELFPRIPAATNAPADFRSWTDEFRDGKRRLRLDRRLLIPADDGATEGERINLDRSSAP